MEIMSIVISSIISTFNFFFISSKYNDNKFSWKSTRVLFLFIITFMLIIFNYYWISNFLKVVNLTIILIIIYKNLFRVSVKESIVVPTMIELTYVLCESLFFVFLFIILGNNINDVTNSYLNSLLSNIPISLMVLLVSNLKIYKNIVNKLNSYIFKIEESVVLFFILLSILIYNLFTVNIYYTINPIIMMIMSATTSLLSFALVILFFKAKTDYYKINDKYDNSLTTLNELENVLSNYRIDNHENKNHLLTIKSMTKNKKVIAFIDSILDSKLKDSSRIMSETSIIPAGGLRGLIYSKLLLMDSKGIDYELEVEKSIRIVNLLDYGNNTMLDVCKIVGIFLDNAIEEIDSYEDKYVIIEMYKKDDKIIISITNPINHDIENDKINNVGYSTKGGKHGYGLSLVDKLVKANSKLKNYPEICEEEFTQILEIYK